MYPFRYGAQISCRILKEQNTTAVNGIVALCRLLDRPHPLCNPHRSVGSFNALSRCRILSQYFQTLHRKPRSSASILRNLSTRAASGSDNPKSGMGPGPGPGPRGVPPDRGKPGEPVLQRLEPSDDSPSKCFEEGYGKPLKPPRRSLLNFCKRIIRIKEKPSNCPRCPPPEPEESFWDYLFKFDDKTIPDPSTCRIALRHREACRKTDPRLSDPRFRRTDGHVLIFTEALRPSCRTSKEPQPKAPPGYTLPKAVACRRFVEAASTPFLAFAKAESKVEIEARCFGPRPFRLPFEECRPARRPRKPFSCETGACGTGVAPPMATDRGTCGGRSVGEILAEATISRTKSSPLKKDMLSKCEPRAVTGNSSRLQRLQKLTEAANCGNKNSRNIAKPSSQGKINRKMSTEAHS